MAATPSLHHVRRPRRLRGLVAGSDGQTLVEFALVLPIMMVLLMAIIEFALAFNAVLGIQRASTDAVGVASVVATDPAADCKILERVEAEVKAPNNRSKIFQVQIQRTSPSGTTVHAYNMYTRGGSMTCNLSDGGTLTVPYTAATSGYPPDQRCAVMGGCPEMTGPTHSSVDTVAVVIRYTYTYHTPLGSLMTLIGGDPDSPTGWSFSKRNLSRLEPIL